MPLKGDWKAHKNPLKGLQRSLDDLINAFYEASEGVMKAIKGFQKACTGLESPFGNFLKAFFVAFQRLSSLGNTCHGDAHCVKLQRDDDTIPPAAPGETQL